METLPLLVFAVSAGGIAVVGYFLYSFVWGAGYEPVPAKSLEKMLEFADLKPGTKVFDLGSGFGRIVIRAAEEYGADCTGVELDPVRVWWSRRAIAKKRLTDARVVRANLLDADLSRADVVFVFLWTGIMQKLDAKVHREMRPGTVIISYYHHFSGRQPEIQDPKTRVYLYKIPPKSETAVAV